TTSALTEFAESDHGAILAQRFPKVGYVERPRRLLIAQAHRRRHAYRLAVGEALRRDARGCHGFMFSRQTAPGDQNPLAPGGDKIVVSDVIVIVEQPLQARLFSGMELDRPG